MAQDKMINVAADFSRFPGGRYLGDGPQSGERFRQELLTPALNDASIVTVQLDGTLGYGSSFLEEAFGGLIRVDGFSLSDLKQKLDLQSRNDILKYTVWEYITLAAEQIPA